MSAPLQTVTKGFDVKATGDYRPVKKDGKVIGELQLRKNGSLCLWIRTVPADAAQRAAVSVLDKNKKWSCRMDVNAETLPVARAILQAAAAVVPAKTVVPKKAAAKTTTRRKRAAAA
jgi:hypothetical protein